MPQVQSEFPAFVTGEQISGASVRCNILGVSMPGLKKIKFGKKVAKENVLGTGNKPVGRSYGQETYEASITMLMSDFLAIENIAPNKDITQIPPFPIGVSFLQTGKVTSYTLETCEFTDFNIDVQTADMSVEIELPLIIGGIVRNR